MHSGPVCCKAVAHVYSISSFYSTNQPGVFYSSLDGLLVCCRVTPSTKFISTNLYSWVGVLWELRPLVTKHNELWIADLGIVLRTMLCSWARHGISDFAWFIFRPEQFSNSESKPNTLETDWTWVRQTVASSAYCKTLTSSFPWIYMYLFVYCLVHVVWARSSIAITRVCLTRDNPGTPCSK